MRLMRSQIMLGLAMACLSLTACAPIGVALADAAAPPGPVAAVFDKASGAVIIKGTQALIVANNAYQGAAGALVPLINAGLFNPSQLATIRQLSDRAVWLLEKGDQGMSIADRAAGVINIATKLHLLKGPS